MWAEVKRDLAQVAKYNHMVTELGNAAVSFTLEAYSQKKEQECS